MSSGELFAFAKIPVGDFESCFAFFENHPAIELRASAEKMLWQTYRTFDRLIKHDYDDRLHELVQNFANQSVQQYALLDYGADCGFENLKKYLHK
ncbi:hypothetical protein EW145_g3624 [Phellinidium pouzarii]|uniref:Uncharacterized protein n=1 Tax=Phellinidium pouzarii TaxID=167371 RepID=A0A4S4L6Q6_9AGAM|nr:hypothetical protein EW145_g3624 [Phellinidium pouzarii]